MKNPFKKSNKTPEGEPLEHVGSGPAIGSKKLVIIAALVTFIVIILVISASVVIVQAGHRGVVLYLGAVENRGTWRRSAFRNTVCGTGHTIRSSHFEISS